jgi:hypothetical protein
MAMNTIVQLIQFLNTPDVARLAWRLFVLLAVIEICVMLGANLTRKEP